MIRAEKASGSRRDGRTELRVRVDFVQPGDTLVVTHIDRLARSLQDLQDIVHELKGRGVTLRAIEQPVDTGTAVGKAFLDMLGVTPTEKCSSDISARTRGCRLPSPNQSFSATC